MTWLLILVSLFHPIPQPDPGFTFEQPALYRVVPLAPSEGSFG